MNLKIIKNYISLSVLALAISGLYSVFIVFLRTPVLSSIFPDKSIFHTALVVHVDLSVLVWMLCFIMNIISRNISTKNVQLIMILQFLIFCSVILMSAAPFLGGAQAYMNNYVPILHNIFFIIGLALFAACTFIICILGLLSRDAISIPISLLGLATFASFVLSAAKNIELVQNISEHDFYEIIFWGGGHFLQFLYCSGLIVAIYELSNTKLEINLQIFLWLCSVLAIPVLFLQYHVSSMSHYFALFTAHMKIFGAIAPLALFGVIAISILYKSSYRNIDIRIANSKECLSFYSISLSILLFMYGGLIALFIDSSNVTIPAHYHGSIVGITIAFMGHIYYQINKYFYKINFKNAVLQLILYSLGQMMHISALFYSGGYGALRKTPGVDLSINAKIAMGFMGLGGIIAILAGLMFVWICAFALTFRENR